MRWVARAIPSRRRDDRGVVAVVVAIITCFALVPLAAFAVDIGVQRVARRDAQAVADLVSLDLARRLDGRTYAVLSPLMQGYANDSAKRNSDAGGGTFTMAVELGTVSASYDPAHPEAYFVKTTTGSVVPTAVRVTANGKVGFTFVSGDGGVNRASVAMRESSACFSMGSYAAAIDSADSSLLSPLNKLLGVNLDLISYKGLAAANLSLADLAADASIGSVDALLGSNVTIGSFTAAAISVLNKQNKPSNAAAISALQAIRVSGIDLSKKVDIAKLVSLQKTDNAALESDVSILDLVAGAIQVANGSSALDISGLNIAGITGAVSVIQGIQRACGVPNDPLAHASASQIRANLNVPLTFPTGNSVLGLTVTGSASVTGGIGNAEGQLVAPPGVMCKSGTVADPDTYRVDVNGGLLGLGVQTNLNINGTVTTGLLGGLLDLLLGVLIKVRFVNVGVTLGVGAPGTSVTAQHADLKVPQNAINTTPRGVPVKTGSAYGGLTTVPTVSTATAVSGQIIITTTGLLGLGTPKDTVIDLSRGGNVGGLIATLLSTVNNVLSTVVNGTVVQLLNNLLTPLGKLLGINAGGADVYSESAPTCNGAKLVG